MNPPLTVLCVGPLPDLSATGFGPFEMRADTSWADAAASLRERTPDALLLFLDDDVRLAALAESPLLAQAVRDTALVVVAPVTTPALALTLVRLGVQELVDSAAPLDPAMLARALHYSVERKRLEKAARRSHATDLATGLPNHTQLLEHMSHLLALREREPAPMALLVLRIEGLETTQRALGVEAANVLRRKVAVRLRGGLRASDVVASLDLDSFAVLLAWIDSPADGQRVATKLVSSLQQPFSLTGQGQTLSFAVGLSQYPAHGKSADELLRRAWAQAGAGPGAKRAGFSRFVEPGAQTAANDEGPS